MTLTTLLIYALAAAGAADLWLDSGLTKGVRARLEARGGLLGELATCRLCVTTEAALWLVLLAYVPAVHLDRPTWQWPAFVLAVSKLGRLLAGSI